LPGVTAPILGARTLAGEMSHGRHGRTPEA
jgi:hypothetical protein